MHLTVSDKYCHSTAHALRKVLLSVSFHRDASQKVTQSSHKISLTGSDRKGERNSNYRSNSIKTEDIFSCSS